MRCSEAVFSTLCLILLLFITTVDTYSNNREIKPIDSHQCKGAAFLADGNRFKLQHQRSNDLTPPRTLINSQNPYIFSASFRKGQTLYIKGKFNWLMGPGSFEMNLLGGVPTVTPDAGADVLHIKLSFDARSGRGGSIIFNTFKRGNWLEEVTTINPFSANHDFWLSFTALPTKFEIRTYGNKLVEYHYRLPLDYITYINAIGDKTTLERLYLGGQIMKAPLRVIFPEGLFRGENDAIMFDAIPTHYNWRLNFSDGNSLILQIAANMDQKVLTLNSRIDHQWGEEVRAYSFPFEAGKMFSMEINIYPNKAVVRVNGGVIVQFLHRVNADAYSEFTFFGSLQIRSLNLCPQKFSAAWIGVKNHDYYAGYITSKTVPYGE